jgi:hypothetical protein
VIDCPGCDDVICNIRASNIPSVDAFTMVSISSPALTVPDAIGVSSAALVSLT